MHRTAILDTEVEDGEVCPTSGDVPFEIVD